MEWIRAGLVLALVLEAFVTLAHAVVGDQRLDSLAVELLQVLFVVVARIGRDQRVRLPDRSVASTIGSNACCSDPDPITSAATMTW